jgi:hypothetical protein
MAIMLDPIAQLSAKQLRDAASIREKIDALEKDLVGIFNGDKPSRTVKPALAAPRQHPKRGGGLTPAGREKLRRALKARWAKAKASGKRAL